MTNNFKNFFRDLMDVEECRRARKREAAFSFFIHLFIWIGR